MTCGCIEMTYMKFASEVESKLNWAKASE
ncbi:hypothetical protein DSM3645_03208 [Blastopirellula marina DSM 3645]|uniref:Uncharacterized protein n=1 Tax=Blastopirellula marina DSM 3645 TaxID=314230 RepID=A3ZVV5_9BACT|nr:hypothetical protein DSM3645_03208 [Blastopirellula marina DSM 3645]